MALVVDLRPLLITDEQFEQICRNNRSLQFERTAQGELVVMAPTGGETGGRNLSLLGQLWLWAKGYGGQGFDSSTGFQLPNGAIRSPDGAWISPTRWQALTPQERRKFLPLCPDFAVELKSPSDELSELRTKMREYQENGLSLGWLIDPETRSVEIYRQGQAPEVLENPTVLSGEGVLPGFVLELAEIFN